MIQPKIQIVLIPVESSEFSICSKNDYGEWKYQDIDVIEKELITFTPKDFEQFKREFGKELLEKVCDSYSVEIFNEANGEVENYPIDFKSVISVLNEFLENNKL